MRKSAAVFASLVLVSTAACARGRCCEPARPAFVMKPVPPPAPVAAETGKRGELFLDTTILELPAGAFDRVVQTKPDPRGTRLSSEEGKAVLQRATKEFGGKTLIAPKILSLPGQTATLFVGEDLPGTPVDADAWAGQRFEATATPTAVDRIRLDFSYAMRDLPAEGAPVDRAAIKASEVRGDAHVSEVRSGDYVLVAVPESARKGRIVIVLTASFSGISPDPLRDARLTVSFRDAPLREVLRRVAEQSSASLIVSPDVPNVPVTADFRDQDVRSILAALSEGRFAWAVSDYGVVRITEKPAK